MPASLEQLPLYHFGDMGQRRLWWYCCMHWHSQPLFRLSSSLGAGTWPSSGSSSPCTQWAERQWGGPEVLQSPGWQCHAAYIVQESTMLMNVLETAAFLWGEGSRTRCSCSRVKHTYMWCTQHGLGGEGPAKPL